jgi:SWI/SNF-related matrix-associated actin-dependent regulator 1 of chromatin subfamily A
LNIKAGGVGLTLTASSNVLFIEEPWTPAEKFQAEDRCHRIGQKNCVNIYTMLGVGTIDEDIYSLLESKRKVINSVNAGVFSDEDFQEDSIIQQLIEKRYG